MLSTLACSNEALTQEWNNLNESYIDRALTMKNFHLNHLDSRYYESPLKTKVYYEPTIFIDDQVSNFIEVAKDQGLLNKDLLRLYEKTIDSIHVLVSDFDLSLDTSYLKTSDLTNQRDYLILSLILYENEILQHFHNFTNASIFTVHPTDLEINNLSTGQGSIRLNVESQGFQMIDKKLLKIDSISRNSQPIKTKASIDWNYSVFTIDLDSLDPGNYQIYGTATGFSGDTKIIENFEYKFEIKTGANK